MKKATHFLILPVMILLVSLLFGCGQTQKPDEEKPDGTKTPCTHEWSDGVITAEPTCGAEGIRTFTCTKCGDTKTETVPATGVHTYSTTYSFDKNGHYRACTGCGVKTETVEHAGHMTETKAPTCLSAGVNTFTCDTCGYTEDHVGVPSADHFLALGSWDGETWKGGTLANGTLIWSCTTKGCDISYTLTDAKVGFASKANCNAFETKTVTANGKTYTAAMNKAVFDTSAGDYAYYARLQSASGTSVVFDFDLLAPEGGLTKTTLFFKTGDNKFAKAPLTVLPDGSVKNVNGQTIAGAGTVNAKTPAHITVAIDLTNGAFTYLINGNLAGEATATDYVGITMQYAQFSIEAAKAEAALGTGVLFGNLSVATGMQKSGDASDPEPAPKSMQLLPLFADHAVFQRGRAILIAGTGEGDVYILFRGRIYEGVCKDGKFTVSLPPMEAGGPYDMSVYMNGKETVLRDIMIGDVILLAGQSNAELPLDQTDWPASDYATNNRVRVYYAEQYFTEEFHYSSILDNKWSTLSPSNAAKWPSIAYHLGQKLEEERDVAVGFVCVVKGAAVIQSFMSEEAQKDFVFDPSELSSSHTSTDRYRCFNAQGMIYHHMFEKILPDTFSSAIWYQGESNNSAAESAVYDKMLAAMIAEWRSDLGDEDLPFAIIGLPNYRTDAAWRAVQEAQKRAARDIPNCTFVDITDLGGTDNIHPKNKKEVSMRIYDVCYAQRNEEG